MKINLKKKYKLVFKPIKCFVIRTCINKMKKKKHEKL